MHISKGFKTPTPDLKDAFEVLLHLLEANTSRQVDVNFFEWLHMYVDASYCPDGHSGTGGLLLNDSGQCLGFFSEKIPATVAADIRREMAGGSGYNHF